MKGKDEKERIQRTWGEEKMVIQKMEGIKTKLNQTPWSESASELYRPSDRRLSAK
jgi:hypothetical protein